MKKLAKLKTFLCGVFTAAMTFCLALGGFALLTNTSATAEEENTGHWVTADNSQTYYSDYNLTYIGASSIIVNQQDILSFEDNTVRFQLQVDSSSAWSGFTFLNGLTGEGGGLTSWTSYSWPSYAGGIQVHQSVIFQDGSGQTYPAVSGDSSQPNVGVENVPGLSGYPITVEVHIGTGTDGDVSYVKMMDSMLCWQGSTTSVFDGITTADFTNGCYMVFQINLAPGSHENIYLTEYQDKNSPRLAQAPSTYYQSTTSVDDTISSTAYIYFNDYGNINNVKVSLNGTSLEEYYLFADAGNGSLLIYEKSGHAEVRITKNLWAKIWNLMVGGTNYVQVTTDTGTIVMMINAIVETPAELTSSDYVELDAVRDVTYTFTSDKTYDASGITVESGVYVGASLSALTADTDYTLTRSDEADSEGLYAYTLTISESYLDGVIGAYRGRYFKITVGDTVLATSLYVKPDAEGWYARSVDLASAAPVDDGYYTTASYNGFSTATLSTRIYYTVALDVTKPITFEFESIPNLNDDRWVLLQVADTLKEMDYFSNDYQSTSKLQALFFGSGRTDIQKLYGFEATASTNANYTGSSNTGILIEIYFGETQSDSYFKINGSSCGAPTAVQSDFENGVAYIGLFSSLSKTFEWTLNSHVNGIAITSPKSDSSYAMDLGAATDFSLELANVQGEVSVKDETGATLASGSDYTYADGTLTIKANYFTNKTFTKSGSFWLWDETGNTGTKLTMAYSSSNLASASVSFATVGKASSVSFELKDVASVTGVLYNDELIDSSLYSFSDGKLTLSEEAVDVSASGNLEFIAIGGSRLYPCYVIVREWSDGVYASGEGTVVYDNGAYTITGIAAADEMSVYDLTKTYTFGIDFRNVGGYYQNGLNTAYTSVTLNFYDPYTGYTLSVTLMANFDDDSVSTVNNALYVSYGIYDAEGNIVFATVSRGVSLANNENNTSSSGLQSLQIDASVPGSVTLNVCGRSYTINSLGGFNVDVCILTVDTNVSTSDSVVEVTVYEGLVDIYETDAPGPDVPGGDSSDDSSSSSDSEETPSASDSDSDDSVTSSPSDSSTESGCGSVVAGGGIAFVIVACALVFVLRKRAYRE